MNNQDTVLTFIGTSAVQPEDGNESACFIVDDHLLVDVGWNAVTQMRRLNIDPPKVKTLILTHFHHDHYMGLPQLLFYLGSNAKLTVIGPAADLEEMVGRAAHFLQADRFEELLPELNLVPLKLGESTTARSYRIDTCEAIHPVPALSYRFTHQSTGVTFAYSGDTSFNEELIPFVKGCQLLIHESSYA